jgi:hypothetical protein
MKRAVIPHYAFIRSMYIGNQCLANLLYYAAAASTVIAGILHHHLALIIVG